MYRCHSCTIWKFSDRAILIAGKCLFPSLPPMFSYKQFKKKKDSCYWSFYSLGHMATGDWQEGHRFFYFHFKIMVFALEIIERILSFIQLNMMLTINNGNIINPVWIKASLWMMWQVYKLIFSHCFRCWFYMFFYPCYLKFNYINLCVVFGFHVRVESWVNPVVSHA